MMDFGFFFSEREEMGGKTLFSALTGSKEPGEKPGSISEGVWIQTVACTQVPPPTSVLTLSL
jgi:hypothetical protein